MKNLHSEFVKLPTSAFRQVNDPLLQKLKWRAPNKSTNTAALIVLICLAFDAFPERHPDYHQDGVAELTYDEITEMSGISRTLVARALNKLVEMGLIKNLTEYSGAYALVGYGYKGWAKLPKKALTYGKKEIAFFHQMSLRNKTELHALKIFIILMAFRSNDTNHANLSYEKIKHYTGVSENDIRKALSYLTVHGLIHVDKSPASNSAYQQNVYRIAGIKGGHLGNTSAEVFLSHMKEEAGDLF